MDSVFNGNGALTVTQLNLYIKQMFDCDDVLSSVAVVGEISNFKAHSSGHLYLTLKDENAALSAVMFRSAVSRLTFEPRNGMKVAVWGRVGVYEKAGQYQIYIENMIPSGMGELAAAYERLKKKLEAEGLFDAERKKPLPRFPDKIGIVTSPTGAAVQDMLNITGRRFPCAEILLYPARVQGSEAVPELCAGLAYLNDIDGVDVIIIGRGGGSVEDLWAFNDERLVRAVAASRVPVISAVGHETDFTLCDFAADMRAPTPSAAAELAVPDSAKLNEELAGIEKKLGMLARQKTNGLRFSLENAEKMLRLRSPQGRVDNAFLRLDSLGTALDNSVNKLLLTAKQRLGESVAKLETLSPLAVLARGYGVMSGENGKIIGSVKQLNPGDAVSFRMSDGTASAQILGVCDSGLTKINKSAAEGTEK